MAEDIGAKLQLEAVHRLAAARRAEHARVIDQAVQRGVTRDFSSGYPADGFE